MIKTIEEAKDRFADYDLTKVLRNDEPHDMIHEIADNDVDIYNSDLLDWVAKDNNFELVDEATEEFGTQGSIIDLIRGGQYKANETILWEAWEEVKKDKDFKHYGTEATND